MKQRYELESIKQLLMKHRNNKSAVARELGMDRANLNRYLRRMYTAGLVDEKYNVKMQDIIDKENYDYLLIQCGKNKIRKEGSIVTCYIIEDDGEGLSVDELEEKYGGFND